MPTPNLNQIEHLRSAELQAKQLFDEIDKRKLVRPGITEKELNNEVFELAYEMFGIRKYWHKRIVRAGKNTLCPYKENPPDLIIQADDILFFDFGPVFDDWEADFGRTYVLGSDPDKLRLKDDIEWAWNQTKAYFDQHQDITGNELFRYVNSLAVSKGWSVGQEHCGHLVGFFPHERILGESRQHYIHPENKTPMRQPDPTGQTRNWILEIHFVDNQKQFGGFMEQLLT